MMDKVIEPHCHVITIHVNRYDKTQLFVVFYTFSLISYKFCDMKF